mgnify:FL=1
MNYQLDRSDNLVIFHINDKKIEGDVSAKYKAQFLIFSQQPDLEAFVINIKDVESIDSAGFGAFLLAYRQLKENLIPVVITGANEYIKSLMSITQIEDLFEFYDTVEEALKVYNTPEQKDN